jgi:hypothetical protein
MTQDDLDRTLSEETGMVPSTAFVGSVMAAVRREASAPPPIPFPWLRVLPGAATGVAALVAMIVFAAKSGGQPAAATSIQDRLLPALSYAVDLAEQYGVGWILLAILVTMTSVKLSMRLTTGTWRNG